MKFLLKSIFILTAALAFMTLSAFSPGVAKADFKVAYTPDIEEAPAVAYNSQTGKFLVAYLIEKEDLTYGVHYELRCQLHNADGTKDGGVLQPFGSGTHEALGRPAIDYNPNLDQFFVVIPAREEGKSGEFVMGRFLNGNGASLVGPDWLFNDGVSTYHEADIGEDVNSLRVVCNTILNEFMVTVQRTVPDIYPPPDDHRNQIHAQRISYSSGLIGSVVMLSDYGINGIDGHSIAYAPIPSTTPVGGRYLFAASGFVGGVGLLDSTGSSITGVPLYMGKPEGGNTHPDIAYGEVDGEKRFLLVYSDEDNCKPPNDSCSGDLLKEWNGVWGTYVDPTVISYGSPNNTPFPISYIWSHLNSRRARTPRVSYNPNTKAFYVVWREIPFLHAKNDENRSHIRGNIVNYFVEDGDYDTSLIPLPASNSNVVISDVSGTCASGVPCYSDEDPIYPDVTASYGSSAVVVWHQQYPPTPTDLDVLGDFFRYGSRGKDELAGDFGASGLWHHDGAAWSKKTSWNAGDGGLCGWDHGLAGDFDGNGLWNHDGANWSKKTSWSPGSGGMVDWIGGLAADFDGNGVWNHNGFSWNKMTNLNAGDGGLCGWDHGLAGDFDGSGLWNYNNGLWSKMTSWDPGSGGMVDWIGGLAADFDGNGLWNHDGANWSKKTSWSPGSGGMAGWIGGLAADFDGNGLWNYDGYVWSKKSSWNPEGMSALGYGLAVDFGANGVWYYNGTTWSKMTNLNAENLTDVDLY